MKKITFLLLMFGAFSLHAQKQPKPNLNKVLSFLQEGKLKEAKEMADAATTFEKTKDDGKTWYYRGLVYLALDTTSKAEFKSLASDAFSEATASFAKADSMAKKDTEYFTQSATDFVPETQTQQKERWANFWLDKGLKLYQDQPQVSLGHLAKTKKISSGMKSYANDTLTYYVSSIVANSEGQYDLAIEDANKYFEKGGKSRDVYVVLYQIYAKEESKKDLNKALEVLRKAKQALPGDLTFRRLEIDLLVQMEKIGDAKKELEVALQKEPNDKQLHYFMGYINLMLKDQLAARTNFENALKIDPNYFEAQYQLAVTHLTEVDRITKEWSALSNSAADSKKRSELIQARVKASEAAIPHLEKAEQMKAPDSETQIDVLEKLKLLYYYVADDKNTARVSKKLKALGAED